jgi:hypothetical protein
MLNAADHKCCRYLAGGRTLTLFPLLMVVATLLSPSSLAAGMAELISNGGFENGLVGWGGNASLTPDAHSGQNAALLFGGPHSVIFTAPSQAHYFELTSGKNPIAVQIRESANPRCILVSLTRSWSSRKVVTPRTPQRDGPALCSSESARKLWFSRIPGLRLACF